MNLNRTPQEALDRSVVFMFHLLTLDIIQQKQPGHTHLCLKHRPPLEPCAARRCCRKKESLPRVMELQQLANIKPGLDMLVTEDGRVVSCLTSPPSPSCTRASTLQLPQVCLLPGFACYLHDPWHWHQFLLPPKPVSLT